ncbi:MAG: NYN domain-containing protein [Chloroflexi bacterium]|nr:NYN domain-containing protein [Chloroflexota bacterium]
MVFIDAQNTYKGARDAFFPPRGGQEQFHTLGNFHPIVLGELLCARRPGGNPKEDRQLEQVRVYSGQPSNARDPKGYAAQRRRVAGWSQSGALVTERPLRYPQSWPREKAQEKGIDVALAVDYVVLAEKGRFDVGIIVSNDTDLRPAVEHVQSLAGRSVEIAVWLGTHPLDQPSKTLWCHKLSRQDYDQIADLTDYNIRRAG